ncbi:MAG TPA: hypothetical protein VFL95_06765 [Gemmatimonadales bacterium]|nr:hypothetical protein [Gemmatimonadales bacterium]
MAQAITVSEQHDYDRGAALTRQEYQANFDSYRADLLTGRHALIGNLAIAAVLLVGAFGLYEVLGYAVGRATRAAVERRRSDSESSSSGFARDLAWLLGVPLVLIGGVVLWWGPWRPPYAPPQGEDVFTIAAGTWDWVGSDSFCVSNRETIAFSPDHRTMTLQTVKPWTDSAGQQHRVARYDLIDHGRGFVRGKIRGEARRTDAGEPVVWDLVLTSHETFEWHRTDWVRGTRTKPLRRCPPTADQVIDQADQD